MLKKDWEFGHVGLVVRDWNIPLGYYQTTGMGVTVGPQVMPMDYQDSGEFKFFYNRKVPRLNGGSGPGKPLKDLDLHPPGPSATRLMPRGSAHSASVTD